MSSFIQPLDSAVWFQRLAAVARGELGSVERSLRHGFHLLQLAPLSFREFLPLSVTEPEFESLLECGDLDTAAGRLVAPPSTVSVEQSNMGDIQALIDFVALDRVFVGTGISAAQAILDGLIRCIEALRAKHGEVISSNDQGPLAIRYEPRPHSSLH
jgi:hypothetical protein